MKRLKLITLVLLILSLFITIDLGLNFLYNLIPEFLDGYTTYSILHAIFGIFGDSNWSLGRYFFAFEKALWGSFVLFVFYVVLALWKKKEK